VPVFFFYFFYFFAFLDVYVGTREWGVTGRGCEVSGAPIDDKQDKGCKPEA
jgi:hypothetical protein